MTRAALLAATLFAVALAAHARVGLDTLFTQTPGEMRFVPDPAHAGYETTVLVGNLTKPGVYAVQTKLPANITIVPHTHGEKWRIANVLSGTLYYAQGDKFDESKLRAPAGQPDRRTRERSALRAHEGGARAAAHRGRRARVDGTGAQVGAINRELRRRWLSGGSRRRGATSAGSAGTHRQAIRR